MVDDERRAEIERCRGEGDVWFCIGEELRERVASLQGELDRVRDARGDDEAARPKRKQRPGAVMDKAAWKPSGSPPMGKPRSPQGEDHEAGIEAVANALECYGMRPDTAQTWSKHLVAAYLSRVSPVSGTEPDAAKLLEKGDVMARALSDLLKRPDDNRNRVYAEAAREDWLAGFSVDAEKRQEESK